MFDCNFVCLSQIFNTWCIIKCMYFILLYLTLWHICNTDWLRHEFNIKLFTFSIPALCKKVERITSLWHKYLPQKSVEGKGMKEEMKRVCRQRLSLRFHEKISAPCLGSTYLFILALFKSFVSKTVIRLCWGCIYFWWGRI